MLKRKPIAAGIVIDTKFVHVPAIKQAIINVILQLDNFSFMDDIVYIYSPEVIDVPTTQGLQIAAAYYFQPTRIDIEDALRQTTYMVGYDCADMEKHVILITDYFDSTRSYKYKKPMLIDMKEKFECQFHFIGLDDPKFDIFEEFTNISYQNVESKLLQKSLQEIIKPDATRLNPTQSIPS